MLGDISIGNNVVIGANAVLICDAPDNTIWAGVPARCIKSVTKEALEKCTEEL